MSKMEYYFLYIFFLSGVSQILILKYKEVKNIMDTMDIMDRKNARCVFAVRFRVLIFDFFQKVQDHSCPDHVVQPFLSFGLIMHFIGIF